MQVGILGTGDVGRALGSGFVQLAHQVKIGSRDANNEKVKTWAAEAGPAASTGSFADAAQFADLAVLCTLWSGTENALRIAGPQNLAGKVLIELPIRWCSRLARLLRWPWAIPIRAVNRCNAGRPKRASSRRSIPWETRICLSPNSQAVRPLCLFAATTPAPKPR